MVIQDCQRIAVVIICHSKLTLEIRLPHHVTLRFFKTGERLPLQGFFLADTAVSVQNVIDRLNTGKLVCPALDSTVWIVLAPQPGLSARSARISCSTASGVLVGVVCGRLLRSVRGCCVSYLSTHLRPVRRVMPNSRHSALKLPHRMAACANSLLWSSTVLHSHGIC